MNELCNNNIDFLKSQSVRSYTTAGDGERQYNVL